MAFSGDTAPNILENPPQPPREYNDALGAAALLLYASRVSPCTVAVTYEEMREAGAVDIAFDSPAEYLLAMLKTQASRIRNGSLRDLLRVIDKAQAYRLGLVVGTDSLLWVAQEQRDAGPNRDGKQTLADVEADNDYLHALTPRQLNDTAMRYVRSDGKAARHFMWGMGLWERKDTGTLEDLLLGPPWQGEGIELVGEVHEGPHQEAELAHELLSQIPHGKPADYPYYKTPADAYTFGLMDGVAVLPQTIIFHPPSTTRQF